MKAGGVPPPRAGTYEWRDHTAEVELAIDAASEEDVFRAALEAFGRLVEREDGGEPVERRVTAAAAERGGLLVAWLEELIFLADSESFVPDAVESLVLGDSELRARVRGRRADLDPLVKAATYHGLQFTSEEGRWRARVVLDV